MTGPSASPSPIEQRYIAGRFGRFSPRAAIEIEAPLETVWAVLTDFPRYAEWNVFTPAVACSGALGSRVAMTVCFPNAGPMRQVEVLNVFEPPRRLAWGMRLLGSASLLVANRYQCLEDLGGGRTRYETVDHVGGLVAPVVRVLYADAMRAGFELAADGLRTRAESLR